MKKHIFTIALFSLLLSNMLAQTTLKDNVNTTGTNLTEANNQFAFNLWQKAKKEDANLFISPLSIHIALNMVYPSATGNTQVEMTKVLGYGSNTVNLKDYAAFMQAFNPKNDVNYQNIVNKQDPSKLKKGEVLPQLRMDLCNSLWRKEADYWEKPYFEDIKQAFQAEMFEFNKKNLKETEQKVDKWVSDKTNGRIASIPIKFDTNTELVLLNAVYFNGDWANGFDEKNTKKRAFSGINKVEKEVNFMRKKEDMSYYEDKEIQAVELPYFSNLYSFVVLLPNEKYGINDLENKLNTSYYNQIVNKMKTEEVLLTLPKFRLESEIGLVENLEVLGMPQAFTNRATFPKLASRRMKISDVVHKTFVEISEKKTEAAAVTAIKMEVTTAARHYKIVNADHPFLFLIKHNPTNTIAFMGRYVKP